MTPWRQAARRAVAQIEDIWQHERFIDEAIGLHLSEQAGAQLTPEQQVLAWVGEGVIEVLEKR